MGEYSDLALFVINYHFVAPVLLECLKQNPKKPNNNNKKEKTPNKSAYLFKNFR